MKNIHEIGNLTYITSDENKKIGDYIYDSLCNVVLKITNETELVTAHQVGYFKVVLTTDADLIADGVQRISYEFLYWFANNPSCEEVKVEKKYTDCSKFTSVIIENPNDFFIYKIIIPQEEIELINGHIPTFLLTQEEPKQECTCGVCDNCEEKESIQILKEAKENALKQQTLEETAERILANNIDGLRDALQDDDLFFFYKDVIQCYGEDMAKWQAERMFSSLSQLINELYDKLPTGEIDAFELLKLIKIHLQKLDDLCGNK